MSGATGALTLDVPALSAVLLRAGTDLPAGPAQAPALSVVGDDLSNMWRVSATVAGSAPVSIGFGVRRANGKCPHPPSPLTPNKKTTLRPRLTQ